MAGAHSGSIAHFACESETYNTGSQSAKQFVNDCLHMRNKYKEIVSAHIFQSGYVFLSGAVSALLAFFLIGSSFYIKWKGNKN